MNRTSTREKLVATALELMLAKGYTSTSVDEVCAKAGVSKGSFYHFFDSKEGIGLAILEHYFDSSRETFYSGDFLEEPDPVRRMVKFLKNTEESANRLWRDGCILGNFAVDLSATHPKIRKEVSRILSEVANGIARVLEPVNMLVDDREGQTAVHLAEQYLATIEGGVILSRAHNDWSYLQRCLHGFRMYIESLID